MNELRKWLDSLKPGDTFYQVGLSEYGHRKCLVKMTVQKRTATQIVMTNGDRYRQDSGRKIGGGYSDYLRIPPSDDVIRPILHEMRERRTIRRLQETDWRKVDPSMRERICALLDEVTT